MDIVLFSFNKADPFMMIFFSPSGSSNTSNARLALATIGISVGTFFPISAGSISICATVAPLAK